MKENTNPLDNIKIASPCGADWNKMFGNDKKRFCADCNLNVYNISEMSQEEAENFILRSEGRLCLRIYKRKDGTVITQNCPVGWARVKRRASLVYKAAVGLAGGFIAGVFGLGALRALDAFVDYKEPPAPLNSNGVQFGLYGSVDNLPAVKMDIYEGNSKKPEGVSFGGGAWGNDLQNVKAAILTSRF